MIRPSLESIYLEFASLLAKRSTCKRRSVGAVITTKDLTQVLGIGYNGGPKGFPNDRCREDLVGGCGDLHSEINALIKCGRGTPDKIMFVTVSPCRMCATAMINSGFSRVHYIQEYRDTEGIDMLRFAGIQVWQGAEWTDR